MKLSNLISYLHSKLFKCSSIWSVQVIHIKLQRKGRGVCGPKNNQNVFLQSVFSYKYFIFVI